MCVCVCIVFAYCICNKMLLWTIYEISYYVNIISTRLQAARLFEKEGKIEKGKILMELKSILYI